MSGPESGLPRDPWQSVSTRHGLKADEVISALQKEIRRGRTENAALLAYEMITTSPELEEKLWQRLSVISVEDVGQGDFMAPVLISSLDAMRRRLPEGGDRGLFAVHAVRFLCSAEKDRSSDEMYAWLRLAVESGAAVAEIPEYAIDMHTRRGRELGRGEAHFYETAAIVAHEKADRDRRYRERILEILGGKEGASAP
jgi:replication-associated recombination protein RarA